jgi:serine/threonine protein kinase
MIGRAISHYQILEKLGEGGMGVVYKAKDTHLDRFVAIKVLPPEKISDPDRRRRFTQEAKAASALNHPNIITIHDIDEADGVYFIAMEFVAGKTLSALIPRHGMRLAEVLKYAIQIADALARAHAAGIIHRDLKPSNIMVTGEGLVKVLDFGLAKLTETGLTSEQDATRTLKPATEEGKIVGTVAYMSPEQAEGKMIDARSDIFSFGSVLYEMLTGRRAFQGDTQASTIAAILKEEPKPPSQIVEGLPREVDRIVRRCLRKDPEQRFQTMADLKVALAEAKEESDSGVMETAVRPTAKPRSRLLWVAGSIVFAAAIIAGAWFGRSKPDATDAPFAAVPLTSELAVESNPTFSPDGNQVAYSRSIGDSDNGIYIKIIGVPGPPRRFTTQPGNDESPAWSPDGSYIAFLRMKAQGDSKATVVRIPLTGSPEQTLAEVSIPGRYFGPRLSWFPNGRWLIMDDCREPNEPCGLSLLSVDTREKRTLTTPPPGSGDDDGPAVSPDGRWLAFSRGVSRGGEISQLYLLELSGDLKPHSEPTQISFENQAHDSPVWTPDGRALLFISGIWETSSLWRMAVSNGPAGGQQRLAFAGQFLSWPAISSQGQRLVYSRYLRTSSEIQKVELSANGGKAAPPVKLIWSAQSDADADYSPDGKRIAFKSSRSGIHQIWVCDSDGSNPIQLTSSAQAASLPHWSPDGRSILFSSTNVEGLDDLFLVNAQGGNPNRLMADPSAGRFTRVNGRFSRDGRWIYFDSNRSGRLQIWKISADTNRSGEKAVQVTRNGGSGGIESPDGKYVYYVGEGNPGPLMKVPAEGGEETQVLPSIVDRNFAVADEGIYFIPAPNQKRFSIQFLSFASAKTTHIAEIGEPGFVLSISPGPRGASRSILYEQHEPYTANLMLVENFR